MPLLPADPHPVIENPVTVRTLAALPAAGAWDATPTEIACAGFRWVTLFLTYTRGAAGGAVDYQIQESAFANDAAAPNEAWFAQSVYNAAVFAAGTDSTSGRQRELETYTATGAGAEPFKIGPVSLQGTMERIRIPCRESGDTDNPGTMEIIAVFNR